MPTEFEKAQERVQAVFGTLDEVVLIVLKGHLLIEEQLDSIIRRFVFHPDHLDAANLRFAQKLQIARSISLNEQDNPMWEVAIRLNSLRNELAHSLGSEKRRQKTQAVIDAYLAQADENEHLKLLRDQPEAVVLAFAASYFIGFLTGFKAEVERFKKVVEAMDRAMNPHLHQNTNAGPPKAKPRR